jgi:uncharacterized surface protein with fasciclin (FAS1) repeats
MVSLGPYTERTNYTHMFYKGDLRGPYPNQVERPGTISYVLQQNPEYSRFFYILKLAKLDPLYNDLQANFTLFVPSNKCLSYIPEDVFVNMDISMARHVIKSSTLNRKITSDILKDSPASFFITQDPPSRLFVSNLSGQTKINNTIGITLPDIICENGIIHEINNIIWPIPP